MEAEATQAESRERWLQKGTVDPAERVPLLGEAMVTAAQHWTDSFSALSASEGEVKFRGFRTARVADIPVRRDTMPILASLRIPAWNSMAALGLDRAVVTTALEAFFGGDGDEVPQVDERPLSAIETRVADVLGGQAASALTAGLRELLPTKVEFDRTLVKPNPLFLGKLPVAVLLATFELRAVGRAAELDVIVPQAVIDARAAVWATDDQAVPIDDAGFTRQLRDEVSRATLSVEASMTMRPLTLGAVSRLTVGQVLELPSDATSTVLLRCGPERLFRCQLGQLAGAYTVRIEDVLEREPQPPRKTR